MNRPTQRVGRPVLALMLAITLAGGVAEAQTKVNAGWNLFSPEQDVQIGRESAAQAESQLPVLSDSQINAYVNDIGRRLASNAGGPQFPYTFRVVNASDINAFALPGGPIYINRGIIENARNEGELAGVLAHEIAHVALRHGTHQASKAYAAQAGLSILGGLLGGKVGNNTAQILNTVGGVGLNALFLKFGRDLETQADVRGAQILAASGYSPADMISFFHQLERVDSAKKTSWLSSHPAPPDRIARIQKEQQQLRVTGTPTSNTQQLASIQTRLRGYGAAPTMTQIAQGTRPSTSTSGGNNPPMTSGSGIGNVPAPSREMRTFTDRGGFSIAYPANWKVYDSNGLGATIAPEGGVGNIGNRTEVVYGAMIAHYEPFGNTASRNSLRGRTTSRNATLNDATSDLLSQIQQSSPHLRLVSNSQQNFNLDGRNALAVSLRGTNPNTRLAERVTVVTRQLDDAHLIYMLFVTPERDAQAYAPVLQAMVRSLNIEDHLH
jgi:hypothetical protein